MVLQALLLGLLTLSTALAAAAAFVTATSATLSLTSATSARRARALAIPAATAAGVPPVIGRATTTFPSSFPFVMLPAVTSVPLRFAGWPASGKEDILRVAISNHDWTGSYSALCDFLVR